MDEYTDTVDNFHLDSDFIRNDLQTLRYDGEKKRESWSKWFKSRDHEIDIFTPAERISSSQSWYKMMQEERHCCPRNSRSIKWGMRWLHQAFANYNRRVLLRITATDIRVCETRKNYLPLLSRTDSQTHTCTHFVLTCVCVCVSGLQYIWGVVECFGLFEAFIRVHRSVINFFSFKRKANWQIDRFCCYHSRHTIEL